MSDIRLVRDLVKPFLTSTQRIFAIKRVNEEIFEVLVDDMLYDDDFQRFSKFIVNIRKKEVKMVW